MPYDKNNLMVIMDNFPSYFYAPQSVTVMRDGGKTQYVPANPQFSVVMQGFKDMLSGARKMPAFGVSLNDETSSATARGVWVELDYGKKRVMDEMSFERLLFEVNASHTGFNLIRYNSACGYYGRCYYFDLTKDMSAFYNIIVSL